MMNSHEIFNHVRFYFPGRLGNELTNELPASIIIYQSNSSPATMRF